MQSLLFGRIVKLRFCKACNERIMPGFRISKRVPKSENLNFCHNDIHNILLFPIELKYNNNINNIIIIIILIIVRKKKECFSCDIIFPLFSFVSLITFCSLWSRDGCLFNNFVWCCLLSLIAILSNEYEQRKL